MRWFNDLSLRIKLAFGPLVLIAALIGLALYALQLLDRNERSFSAMSEGAFRHAALVSALGGQVNAVQARLYQLTSIAANDSDAKKAEAMGAALRNDIAGIDRAFAAMTQSLGDDPDYASLRDAMAKTLKSYTGAAGQVIDMSANSSYALIFMNAAQESFDVFAKEETELGTVAEKEKAELLASVRDEARHARVIFVSSTIVAVLLAFAVTLLLGHLIARPVVALAEIVKRLAQGELAVETPYQGRRDEIGAIADALGVFKDTANNAKKLEAEAEQRRALREQRTQKLHERAAQFDQEVTGVLSTVAAAADELQATATSMAEAADRTSQQSSAAMSAAERAAGNVNAVASAAEELAASVAEIGRQVEVSTQVAGAAVEEAAKSNRAVRGLA